MSAPAIPLAISTSAIAAAGTLTYAALHPTAQIFGRTLIAGDDPAESALTYDDGPNDRVTEALLDLLAAHNARATFFMIGRYVRQRPALVRRVHVAGHCIGNHTDTHPWLTWQSAHTIRDELTRCQHTLEDTLGQPVRYLRPPHGAVRPAVFRIAHELGLQIVQWNATGKDWQPIGVANILRNLDRATERNRHRGRGTNVLLHDGSDQALGADRSATITVTAQLLQRWQRDGTRAVTVDAWDSLARKI